MNASQMAQQIKHELELATWPEAGGSVVFGTRGVLIVTDLPGEKELPQVTPFALVVMAGGTNDPDDPNLIEQTITVLAVSDVAGDPDGEGALLGGAQSVLGKSANRGVFELSGRVRAAVTNLTGADGAKLLLQGTSTGATAPLGAGRHRAVDESSFLGWVTAAPSYPHPVKVTTGANWTYTGGTAAARGHCSGVYNFLHYAVGYKAGGTPAASYHDFDGIAGTSTTEALTITAIGGNTYSLVAVFGRSVNHIEGSSNPAQPGTFYST